MDIKLPLQLNCTMILWLFFNQQDAHLNDIHHYCIVHFLVLGTSIAQVIEVGSW